MKRLRIEFGGKALDALRIDADTSGAESLPRFHAFQSRSEKAEWNRAEEITADETEHEGEHARMGCFCGAKCQAREATPRRYFTFS